MFTIRIKNRRTDPLVSEWDVPVDRTGKSPLGNPFWMRDEMDRDDVCKQYASWFARKVQAKDKLVIDELNRLYRIGSEHGQLNLFCWCAPKRCHAEVIKDYLERKGQDEKA